ncbi:hypothetical protein EYF80_045927 [Liparis tanakae]|uniref:Uncharacterized protein n=1 Tax=Liparis tanakae TaxID=230148 RepID=A0A4Z2FSY8_9TELE|nr:hypothetical protein EYF80_045927 [Liparis tanakae]
MRPCEITGFPAVTQDESRLESELNVKVALFTKDAARAGSHLLRLTVLRRGERQHQVPQDEDQRRHHHCARMHRGGSARGPVGLPVGVGRRWEEEEEEEEEEERFVY